MVRNKPYLDTIRQKHPTIAHDASAYSSAGKKTFEDNYTTILQNVETIDRAIRTISNIMSLATIDLVKTDNKGKTSPAKVKNIDFNYPNETDSIVDFMRKLAANVFMQGAALIVTEEGKRGKLPGTMENFYVVDTSRIEAESDGKKLISQFTYKAEDGTPIVYKAEDCIYINDSIDTSNLLYSLSRLKSLNDVILMQSGIVAQSKDMLNGGAKSSVILSSDVPISKTNLKIIKKEFDAFMQSSSSNSLFMNTKLNVQKIGNDMSGSDILGILREVNDIMIKHFNLPPYLLGDYESGANRNTEITYALRIYFTSQIKPVFKNIELQLTRFLTEQMGLKNISAKFNYDDLDILKLSQEEQSDMILKQLKGGLISLNEARDLTEYSPIDGDAADKVFMPAYALGSSPVSYNDYDSDLERMLQVTKGDTVTPSGNAGGTDNTNVVTDSTGGPGNVGETKAP